MERVHAPATSSPHLCASVWFFLFYRGCASHQCDTYCVCDPAAVALLMGAHQTSMCQANWLFSWSGEQASAFLKAAHKTGMGDNTPFSLFFFERSTVSSPTSLFSLFRGVAAAIKRSRPLEPAMGSNNWDACLQRVSPRNSCSSKQAAAAVK